MSESSSSHMPQRGGRGGASSDVSPKTQAQELGSTGGSPATSFGDTGEELVRCEGVPGAPAPSIAQALAGYAALLRDQYRISTSEFVARRIRANFYGKTDVGLVRGHNEDNFLAMDPATARRGSAPEADGEFHLTSRGLIFAVCDGMGGAAAGEIASQMAVDTLFHTLSRNEAHDARDAFAQALRGALEKAGTEIYQSARVERSRRGMGTTATVAGLIDDVLFMGQVGDSRAYVLREGQLFLLTKDQSLVNQLIEAGQLTEEEAAVFEHSNIILQALGTSESVSVDVTFAELRRGDRLLLCSDGLSGLVQKDVIEQVMTSRRELAGCAAQLIELAKMGGGHDNITVLLVDFDGEDLPPPGPGTPLGYAPYRMVDFRDEEPEVTATSRYRLDPRLIEDAAIAERGNAGHGKQGEASSTKRGASASLGVTSGRRLPDRANGAQAQSRTRNESSEEESKKGGASANTPLWAKSVLAAGIAALVVVVVFRAEEIFQGVSSLIGGWNADAKDPHNAEPPVADSDATATGAQHANELLSVEVRSDFIGDLFVDGELRGVIDPEQPVNLSLSPATYFLEGRIAGSVVATTLLTLRQEDSNEGGEPRLVRLFSSPGRAGEGETSDGDTRNGDEQGGEAEARTKAGNGESGNPAPAKPAAPPPKSPAAGAPSSSRPTSSATESSTAKSSAQGGEAAPGNQGGAEMEASQGSSRSSGTAENKEAERTAGEKEKSPAPASRKAKSSGAASAGANPSDPSAMPEQRIPPPEERAIEPSLGQSP